MVRRRASAVSGRSFRIAGRTMMARCLFRASSFETLAGTSSSDEGIKLVMTQ
jgi:hypothetical protein